MPSLKNKVIWITGASSGIGEALAYALSEEGARLVLSSRRVDALERVKGSCKRPEMVAVLPLDLEKTDNKGLMAEAAVQFFGHIDILINNGGVSQRSLARDTLLEVDQRIMRINYFGTIAITKAILPHMIARKSGHIVVVSSLVGKFGTPSRSAYSASKHALHGFFDALRAEEYENNLKVTMVCPGFVKTDVTFNALTATGEKLNKMGDAHSKSMEPAVCARKIVKAIERQKQEVYIGGKEVFGVYVKRFFPRLFSKFIRKAKVT